jgi:dihydrofolate reductase
MRTVLIATQSADGFIAKDAHHLADWSSQSDKGTFVRLTKELGTMVMGANTFATITRDISDRRTIVYTHHPERVTTTNATATTEAPASLSAQLAAAGTTGLAICGGAEIYTQFMEAGLINELYIVTEAVVFGRGITLFNRPITATIELIESTTKRGVSVINHYKVIHPSPLY